MQKMRFVAGHLTDSLAGCLAAVCAIYLLGVMGFYVTRSYPLEYREGSVLVQMSYLFNGLNPFSLESHPLAMNGYGVLLGLLTYPFVAVFGESFAWFRLVAGGFLLASTILIYLIFRFERFGKATAALASLCFLSLLVRSPAITGRPDSIGIFILIGALALLHLSGYSKPGFYISILLCCLGWLAKPYFIIGMGAVCLYAFFCRSYKLGLALGLVFVLAFAVLVGVVASIFPMYLTDTFFTHFALASNSVPHLTSQLLWILIHESPLLVAFAVVLFSSKNNSIFLWQLGLSCLVFLKLGLHAGSREYSLHLVTPFLILVAATSKVFRAREWALTILLIAQLLLNLPSWPVDRTNEWTEIENVLKSSRLPFLNNPTTVHLAYKLGSPVYDSGQQEYFKTGAVRWNPRLSEVIASQDRFDRDLTEKIHAKHFGLILQTMGRSGIFEQWDLVGRYKLAGRMIAYCGVEDWPAGAQNWPIEFWESIGD